MAKRVSSKDKGKKEEEPKKKEFGLRWYSLRVISGKEKSISERILLEMQRCGWTETVTQVIVPTEKVFKVKDGKKAVSFRNILPGYIIVQAESSKFRGDISQHIQQMTNVIYFLGRENPIPMAEADANRLLGKVDETMSAAEVASDPFNVGDQVKITDGPFNDFLGEITFVNDERKKLKVTVKIFGRPTEVELSYLQVDRNI